MRQRLSALVALLAVCLPVVVFALVGPSKLERGGRWPFGDQIDFRAFYCAGQVLRDGHDPYRVEPLRTCEVQAARRIGIEQVTGLVVPAPLPPYALVPFEGISIVPYPNAAFAWYAILIVANVASMFLLRVLTRLPMIVLGIVTALSIPITIANGQVVPVAVLCLILSAALLRMDRNWASAAAASIAMIEPHIALPACIALFLARPKMRAPFIVIASGFALLSIAVAGQQVAFEYIASVLPRHAHSELHAFNHQMSLTTFLVQIGLNEGLSIRLGEIDYIVTLVLAVFVARKLSIKMNDGAFLALLPPAFIVIGGIYVHQYQFLAVLPASLLAFATLDSRWRLTITVSIGFTLAAIVIYILGPHYALNDNAQIIAKLMRFDPRGFASDSVALYHTFRMPSDADTIRRIAFLKIPPLMGAGMLLVIATLAGLREPTASPIKVVATRSA